LERRIAGYRSICIFKVLRPANLSKAFRGFPRSWSKRRVVSQNPSSTACLSCSTPTETNVKFFANAQPTQPYENFVLKLSSKHKVRLTLSTSCLCRILPAVHFPKPYIATGLPLPEGRAGKCRDCNVLHPIPFFYSQTLFHPWFVVKGFMWPC